MWNWRTGTYGNEGGEANKEKGQYMFSDQFGFIFLNMGAVQPKPYAKAEPPKAKKDTYTDGKVNLNLNLLVIEILNALSV